MEISPAQSQEELLALIRQMQAIITEQAAALKQANARIAELEQEIARLKAGGGDQKPARSVPDFVKSNTRPTANGERKPRKKRAKNFTFHRHEPTAVVEHACECCPDCGRGLSGGWEYSRRQVLEIAPVSVEVTDHIVRARRCGVCGSLCVPDGHSQSQAGGEGRIGVRLQSLIAYLRTAGRLPVESIRATLSAVWGLSLSAGAIVGVLHRVAKQGQATYDALLDGIRAHAFVNADETGWREDGQNGYLWSFSTPSARSFVYDKSRSHRVPERVLAGFKGVLVSDFYSGYHYYPGLHQRCWVHLLRDLHDLKKQHPRQGVKAFADAVGNVYDQAKAFHSDKRLERVAARLDFQAQLLEVAMPYQHACLPQSVLASRIVQFESELFTFVEHPEIPSENNAAERAVRPRVIARKISGGSRSPTGSATMAVLASLFETWRLRGEDALEACRVMLTTAQPAATPART